MTEEWLARVHQDLGRAFQGGSTDQGERVLRTTLNVQVPPMMHSGAAYVKVPYTLFPDVEK